MNLTKLNWPLGWNPSSDRINGNPNALLRMDNLQQEEDGSIGLIRDFKAIKSYSAPITDIHTKSLDGIDYLWVGGENGQFVREVKIDGSVRFAGDILSGGGTRPVISDAFGFVLACSGSQRKKFDGTNVYKLGLETPAAPLTGFILNASEQLLDPSANGGSWELEEGHDLTGETQDAATFNPDATTLRAVLKCDFGAGINALKIGAQQSSNPGDDSFFLDVQMHDSAAFATVRVELNLDADGTNYYWFEWPVDSSTQYSQGIDTWSSLSAKRSLFNRQGSDLTLDWKTIISIRIVVTATADTWIQIDAPRIVGGIDGQLYGSYQYIYRYVKNMGSYIAKSPFSPVSDTFTVVNGSAALLPPAPSDTTTAGGLEFAQCEIYRRSVPSTESYFNPLTDTFTQLPDLLDQFYLIGTVNADNEYFKDTTSDNDALVGNTVANVYLLSVQDIPEPITGIIGVYNERTIYLTASSILLGDRLNPDCVDSRYVFKVSGASQDINLFITKITNSTLLLGSTLDLYEISGTLLDLPDGTVDINIRGVGEAYAPISTDFCNVDGLVFYTAADGIRTTGGSNSNLISSQLNLLFQGLDRHGIPAIQIMSGGIQRYPIAVGDNKLYVSIQHTDGKRRLHVYDLQRQTWSLRNTEVTGVVKTQSDNVVFGMGSDLVWTEYGNTYTNATALPVNLLTVYDNNGQPRNRKDTFTLKLVLDTGGVDLSVYVAKDGGAFTFVQNVNTTGITTVYISLHPYTLGFRYALQLIGSALKTLKIVEYTIEYDARPEQVNYLFIPASNLGTTARKKFGQFGFSIDTLGNNVQFTPIVDGITLTAQVATLVSSDKLTRIYQFLTETVGIDIGGILEGVGGLPFEYYGIESDKIVYAASSGAYDYLLIPPSNFGSPNRKRFTSIKFVLDTHGDSVDFTPILDGVAYATQVFSSVLNRPKTCEYFFDTTLGDVTAIDIGCEIKYTGLIHQQVGFEFYGPLQLQQLETLPPRLESLYISETNFGHASRKRIRTLPLVINTNGHNVTFVPIVDGANDTTTIFNTPRKKTVFHYFKDDSFGIDYAGFLSGTNPFEFHELATPVGVEVLPVGKKYDQLGPLRFDKIGKLLALRVRLILIGTTTSIPFEILGEDQEAVPSYDLVSLYNGSFPITPGVDNVYEIQLPKSINGTIFRVILGPTDDPFHRYDLQARVQISGMETDAKWIPIK